MELALEQKSRIAMKGREVALWRSVLQEAFLCALGEGNVTEAESREALAWFASCYPSTPPPGSFEWCCLMLGVSPEKIRRRLRVCMLLLLEQASASETS